MLKDAAGVPQATISATSYVREGVRDRATRPVMVFFNGGPGASSSPLHFEAFGPRRRPPRSAGPEAPMLDNPASPIDVADLLFVDPVGTGFSRELRPGGGKPYWSTTGDPASVLALVRDWLRDNGREAAPLIVIGQSYGGTRAALMARDMGDLNVAALVLVSPALDYSAGAGAPGNDNPYVFSLPTMAVAAWHHGKVARDGREVAQVWEAAREFAQGDYLRALALGSDLPQAEKARIAARVAALLALPVADVLAANLRVDSQAFLEEPARHRRPRRRPAGYPRHGAEARDAAERGAPRRRQRPVARARSQQRDPLAGRRALLPRRARPAHHARLLRRHARRELQLGLERRPHRRRRQPALLVHDHAEPRGAAARPSRARGSWSIGGYFDLATPLLGVQHALAHADLPADRVELLALPGSHSPYDDPASLDAAGHPAAGWHRGRRAALRCRTRPVGRSAPRLKPGRAHVAAARGEAGTSTSVSDPPPGCRAAAIGCPPCDVAHVRRPAPCLGSQGTV